MRRIAIIVAVASLGLAVAACGDREPEQVPIEEEVVTPEVTTDPSNETAPDRERDPCANLREGEACP